MSQQKPIRISGDIQLNYHDTIIHEEDIQRLEGDHRLNETLLVFYMDYLIFEEYTTLDICCLHPELTQCIRVSPEIKLFLDPLNFKSKKYAIMCLNDVTDPYGIGGSHCSLLVYCREELKFYHLDSSENINFEIAKMIAIKVCRYIGKKKCEFEQLKTPQQKNSYDCGVYFCCNLDNVLHHLFTRRSLSELKPFNEIYTTIKRNEIKWLIINLYLKQLEDERNKKQLEDERNKQTTFMPIKRDTIRGEDED